MSITRRTFLKLSAASAAAAAFPFGSGCAADDALSRDISLAASDALVYFAGDLAFHVDQRRHRVVVRNATGEELAVLGGFGLDGARLNFPTDVAFDADRSVVYVADRGNHRVQMYGVGGGYLGQLGAGFGDGAGELSYPAAVALDGNRVIVADSGNHRLQRFTLDGRHDGTFGHESLSCPVSVTVDARGRLHVASTGEGGIHVYDRTGALVFSYGHDELFRPRAVIASPEGAVFVGDDTQAGIFVYDDRGGLMQRRMVEGNYGVAQLSLSPEGFVHAAAHRG